MPSKSPSQTRLMAACAHGAGYPSCPPAKVAREFNQADKGGVMLGKSQGSKSIRYAEGGAVHGKTSEFLKTPDAVRTDSGVPQTYGKGGGGQAMGNPNPKAHDKGCGCPKCK